MVRKTIAFCTGTRAEYGLLKPVMDLVRSNPDKFEFQLFVTGSHLSPEFGRTVSFIEADGMPIAERVDILLSGDTPAAVTKSMGLAMIGFADVFARRHVDMLVLLGDRYEAFCVAAAATVARVAIAHLHGGESTEGAIDDAFRHSITKMSALHLTATEAYRGKVIQLGEDPARVHNVGALGVELALKTPLVSLETLGARLGAAIRKPYAVITFHPETLAETSAKTQFDQVLEALGRREELFLVFTKANADADGRIINAMIDDFVARNPGRSAAFASMGQQNYFSAIKEASFVAGNSSSGVIEVPSFGIPTVNIGSRQRGRVFAESVISCDTTAEAISGAMDLALSPQFREKCRNAKRPYEGHDVAARVVQIIEDFLSAPRANKSFYTGEAR